MLAAALRYAKRNLNIKILASKKRARSIRLNETGTMLGLVLRLLLFLLCRLPCDFFSASAAVFHDFHALFDARVNPVRIKAVFGK